MRRTRRLLVCAISGTERMLRELRQAQLAEAEAEREDVVRQVLISPRQRQNVIERIVHTYSGRVYAEYWHETGWRRNPLDLRTVLTGRPLPARVGDAVCRQAGNLDELPTEECLARMKKLDPLATATVRLTEAELLDDTRAHDLRFTGSDVTNAAIAAELLYSTRAIWRSVTLEVEAPADGAFRLSVYDTGNPKDRSAPSGRLRSLVARRYEAVEDNQKRAWRRFRLVASRAELPEWRCDVKYEFAP